MISLINASQFFFFFLQQTYYKIKNHFLLLSLLAGLPFIGEKENILFLFPNFHANSRIKMCKHSYLIIDSFLSSASVDSVHVSSTHKSRRRDKESCKIRRQHPSPSSTTGKWHLFFVFQRIPITCFFCLSSCPYI